MIRSKIINKYTERIIVDYPEADKIHIDLVQFAEELNQYNVDKLTPLQEMTNMLKSCRDTLAMCILIDKSGLCKSVVSEVDNKMGW